MPRILVPVDFSKSSEKAAQQAALLARRFESQITLLYVNEMAILHPLSGPLGYGISSPVAVREEFLAQRMAELESFASRELQGLETLREVSCGDPARVIVERAQTGDADLIVMPTHGYGPVRQLLLGSVTAKVLHDSDRPIWSTPVAVDAVRGPGTIRQILCAVAFRPNDAQGIRWAAGFAEAFGAKLVLAHAIQPAPREMPDQYARTWQGEARWAAEEQLRVLAKDAEVQGDRVLIEGDAPAALAALAKERNIDLIVIGRSHPSNRIGRLGSHSYRIISQAPCPVVSL